MTAHIHEWAKLAAQEGHKKRLPPSPASPAKNGRSDFPPDAAEQVTRLLSIGCSQAQIARQLGLSAGYVNKIAHRK